MNEWLNLTSFLGEPSDSDVHVIHITHVIITCSLETLSSHEAVAQQIMKQTDETWPKDMATRYINGRQGDIRRWVCRKNWILLQCVRYVSFFFSSHLFKCSRDLSVFIFKFVQLDRRWQGTENLIGKNYVWDRYNEKYTSLKLLAVVYISVTRELINECHWFLFKGVRCWYFGQSHRCHKSDDRFSDELGIL